MSNLFTFSLLLFFSFSCSQTVSQRPGQIKNKIEIKHGLNLKSKKATTKAQRLMIMKEKLDQASMERGRVLYTQHCLHCHGEKGQGNGPDATHQSQKVANLRELVSEVKDFDFFMSISQWKGNMPGWKDHFNEAEREDLVTYIKSFRHL